MDFSELYFKMRVFEEVLAYGILAIFVVVLFYKIWRG